MVCVIVIVVLTAMARVLVVERLGWSNSERQMFPLVGSLKIWFTCLCLVRRRSASISALRGVLASVSRPVARPESLRSLQRQTGVGQSFMVLV